MGQILRQLLPRELGRRIVRGRGHRTPLPQVVETIPTLQGEVIVAGKCIGCHYPPTRSDYPHVKTARKAEGEVKWPADRPRPGSFTGVTGRGSARSCSWPPT